MLLPIFLLNMFCPQLSGYAETGLSVVGAGPVSPLDTETVLVIFSQPVNATTAENPSHFTLDGESVFRDARLDCRANNLVYLTLKPAHSLTSGVDYRIAVTQVTNLQGEVIKSEEAESVFRYCDVDSEVQQILNCRLPDGALAMRHTGQIWTEGEPIWICPYFAHYAALGLLYAHKLSPNPEYLDTVRGWLKWYATHMRDDNTVTDYKGIYPDWSSTGDYDASDSYSAFFLIVLNNYFDVTTDPDFLEWAYPYVAKAIKAIDLTSQPDALTWAKPTYHVKYTMDNTEVWWGFRAAAEVAAKKGDLATAEQYGERAQKVRDAVHSHLYLGDSLGRYAVGMFEDGTYADTWAQWYAEGMAQCMVLGFQLLEPQDPRAERVWKNVTDKFVADYLPQKSAGFFLTFAAIRMNEKTYADIGYVMMLKNKRKENWLHEAGFVLHIAHYLNRASN